jgi:hypothetical protein
MRSAVRQGVPPRVPFFHIGFRAARSIVPTNEVTGANAGGPRQVPMPTRWAARVAQFVRPAVRTSPRPYDASHAFPTEALWTRPHLAYCGGEGFRAGTRKPANRSER